jgi:hypothetical protein
LWDTVSEYEAGLVDPTPEDYRTKSAAEHQAKLVLAAAHYRERDRQIKRQQEQPDG